MVLRACMYAHPYLQQRPLTLISYRTASSYFCALTTCQEPFALASSQETTRPRAPACIVTGTRCPPSLRSSRAGSVVSGRLPLLRSPSCILVLYLGPRLPAPRMRATVRTL